MLHELTIESSRTILDTLKKIDKNAQGIIFVVQDDFVLGTVTDGDIRRAMIAEVSLQDKVESICNRNFIKLLYSDSVENIQSTLNKKIKYIPLVDENNKLVDFASIFRLKRTPILEPFLGGNELEYVTDCVKTNWVSSQGKYVSQFENEIAKYTGASYALAVSNGTVALHLSLVALGIGPGDEVIVPDITFAATLNAVILAGATPVIVDVDPESWNISAEHIEAALSSKTKAIIPVHLYGIPCDMEQISALADAHQLLVIEDAAQAFGSRISNTHVGTTSDAGTFSFFGNKIITCGEGGAILFKNQDVYNKAKVLRDHGMTPGKRYWHEHVGFNYRLTNLQAAIGCAQLEQLNEFRQRRTNIFQWYDKYLLSSGLFEKQIIKPHMVESYWLYTLKLRSSVKIERDNLSERLAKIGIDTRPVFYPMSIMPAYAGYRCHLDGVSHEVAKHSLSFPTSVYLEEEEVKEISRAVIDTIISEK